MRNSFFSFFNQKISNFSVSLLIAASMALLAGCGSGVPPGTATGGTAAAPTLVLQLYDAAGAVTTLVSPSAPATVQATLKDATGTAVANTVVTFTITDTTLATVGQATALTNSSGIATVTVSATGAAGATSITASATVTSTTAGALTVTGSTSFAVVASGGTSATPTLTMLLTNSSGIAITTVTPSVQGTVKVTVKDTAGVVVPGSIVTFSITNTALATVSQATALTDSFGVATVKVTAEATGATSITASSVVGGITASSSLNFSVATNTPSLSLELTSTAISTGSPSIVTATLKDGTGTVMSGVSVTFTVDNPTLASVSPVSATTNAFGVATATLTAGTGAGSTSVQATAPVNDPLNNNLVTSSQRTFSVGTTIASLAMSASPTTVKSDNSTSTTVTVTALSAANAATPGVVVSLSANTAGHTGIVSTNSVTTDATGRATFTFSSGTADKSNRTAYIHANAGVAAQLPVDVVGTTLTVNATGATVPDDGTSPVVMTFTAMDAGGNAISGATVTLTKPPGVLTTLSSTSVTDAASGLTNSSGKLVVYVKKTTTGAVSLGEVTATAMGATASAPITVTSASATFAIIQSQLNLNTPIANPASVAMQIGDSLVVLVKAPAPIANVMFATTMGSWNGSGSSLSVGVGGAACGAITPAADEACATLTTAVAGLANVQVYDTAALTTSDSMAVSMTATTPYKVTLQASPSTVPKSLGATTGASTLVATVTDSFDRPVGNVVVKFDIVNPTGGGESVNPVAVSTAATATASLSLGQARTQFTSGSLSSGASGVHIRASVDGYPAVITNTAPSGSDAVIVIGGTAGSISFGAAAVVSDTANATAYKLAMSVLVTDSGGNPAPAGTVINLSAWPIAWSTGANCTYDLDYYTLFATNASIAADKVTVSVDSTAGLLAGDRVYGGGFPSGTTIVSIDGGGTDFVVSKQSTLAGPFPVAAQTISINSLGTFYNEDVNENFFRDGTEDGTRTYYYNGASSARGTTDGLITPPSASAGTVPDSVTIAADPVTGLSTGMATFDFVYPKSSAIWTVTRLRAETVVLGTERKSEVQFRLAPSVPDSNPPSTCHLPDSPYYY